MPNDKGLSDIIRVRSRPSENNTSFSAEYFHAAATIVAEIPTATAVLDFQLVG